MFNNFKHITLVIIFIIFAFGLGIGFGIVIGIQFAPKDLPDQDIQIVQKDQQVVNDISEFLQGDEK